MRPERQYNLNTFAVPWLILVPPAQHHAAFKVSDPHFHTTAEDTYNSANIYILYLCH